jgi:hypothetical protein
MVDSFGSPEHIVMLLHMEMEGELDQLFCLGTDSGSRAFHLGLEIPSWLNQVPHYREGFLGAYDMERKFREAEETLRRLSGHVK